MKILHIVSSLNVGGAERFVIDLSSEQKQLDELSVAILSMGAKTDLLLGEVTKQGIGLYHHTKLLELRNVIKDFDLIHVHSSHCLPRILIAAIGVKAKIVYTRHNEVVHRSLKWKLVYLYSYFKLHKMTFVAEKARLNYLDEYPRFTDKSCTVLNGVRPMTGVKQACDKFRLSHVGRFVPLKAQHVLIEALASLSEEQRKNLSISFYGTGELMEKNQQLAAKIIPDVEVNFKGFVTDREAIYGETDLLVVTSETEGLSLAIIESLASRTPVIASHVGGNPELVIDEENGYLYPYADAKRLGEQILLLSQDQERYRKFQQNAVAKFNTEFSMSICAKNYFNIY